MPGLIVMYFTCTRCDFQCALSAQGTALCSPRSVRSAKCAKNSSILAKEKQMFLALLWLAAHCLASDKQDSGSLSAPMTLTQELVCTSCVTAAAKGALWCDCQHAHRWQKMTITALPFFTQADSCHNLFACREYMWKWRMTVTIGEYSNHSPIPPSKHPEHHICGSLRKEKQNPLNM